MKIGIYGGTFNPPHLGHVAAARAAFETLKLDRLLLVPTGMPPHKTLPAGSPTPEQRLEMTRLAGEQLNLGDLVETLDIEARREGRSYTATAGGGVVTAVVSGKKELTELVIDPEAVDPEDVEMLQDMIIAAVNSALSAADAAASENMSRLTGGLDLGF